MKDNFESKKRILESKKAKLMPFISMLQRNLKDIRFVIILVLAAFVINSFIVFRINYTENYSLVYRYERPTIILGDENYLEVFKFHDYIQYSDKGIEPTLSTDSRTEANETQNIFFGVNAYVTEKIFSSRSNITSEFKRIDENNFELIRTIKLNKATNRSIDSIYYQIILGGEGINFKSNTITYANCEIKIYPDFETNVNYQEKERTLILGKKVRNNSEIKFNIKFKINCG